MRKVFLLIVMAATHLIASAQLQVTSDGKVKIASSLNTSHSNLLVGNYTYGTANGNVGISGSTTVMEGKRNVGVLGTVSADPNITDETNMGVFGVVYPINNAHGRNYGLCGMIRYNGDYYGGAGIFASNSSIYFEHPISIQGNYAGYFRGPVHITGTLTAPNLFIPSDSRQIESIVSLNERGVGTNTLDKLLAMNVIEYNMKSRITDEFPNGIKQDAAEEEWEAYEYLKKEDMEMSSRRHFGIDAEELQSIYPDLVQKGQDGYLAVNYVELVPVLIRAIQELKQELETIKGNDTERRAPSVTGFSTAKATDNVLYQNTPNPFNEQTTIRFSLADDTRDASICIFDMTGKMLKKQSISSGDSSIRVNGWELGEGMFLYSLIVNGQVIDTKRMLISK